MTNTAEVPCLVWCDPPTRTGWAVGMNRSALTDAMGAAVQSPDTWVRISTYSAKRSAEEMASQLRHGKAARYRAEGTWAFRIDWPGRGDNIGGRFGTFHVEAKFTPPAKAAVVDNLAEPETIALDRGPGSLVTALDLVAERPGQWARLSTRPSRRSADDQASDLRRGRTANHREPGKWDFAVSQVDGERYGVWARHTPAPPT